MKRNKTFMSNSKTTELSQFVRLSSMNTILYNPTSALTKNDNNHNGSGVKLVAYNENSFLKATGKYSQNMPKISKTDSFLINSGKKRQQSNIELNAKEIFQPKISELNDIKRLQRNQIYALNELMTRLENESFQAFCKKNNIQVKDCKQHEV